MVQNLSISILTPVINNIYFADSTGFLFDPEPIQNTWDLYKASRRDDYSLLLVGLAGDVDEAIAKQMKTWNDAGLQEVLKEYNKQYEEFLKQMGK